MRIKTALNFSHFQQNLKYGYKEVPQIIQITQIKTHKDLADYTSFNQTSAQSVGSVGNKYKQHSIVSTIKSLQLKTALNFSRFQQTPKHGYKEVP
ncbi:hypothetical protein DRF67_13345 [Chryseobacterium pennipullorum]|uniref:Uncharacterized protein n=1 Tax=Chryseobacterium pennipullorum TaxID=2258963 RepID=A0A3D9B099_9FLAO|nr:hypothetical protein DRF67_13345 [Chryseobacterium pennipullorum]